LACLVVAGCVTHQTLNPIDPGPPPVGVDSVAAFWEKRVQWGSDPLHGDKRTPGLAGRVLLFAPNSKGDLLPVAGDGDLIVDLFDDASQLAGQPPRNLEKWIIKNDTLKKRMNKDLVGVGYSLELPWSTYKPEITRIHLRVTYQPPKGRGEVRTTSSTTMVLQNGDLGIVHSVAPGAALVAAPLNLGMNSLPPAPITASPPVVVPPPAAPPAAAPSSPVVPAPPAAPIAIPQSVLPSAPVPQTATAPPSAPPTERPLRVRIGVRVDQ
jgi:hypothetical protein